MADFTPNHALLNPHFDGYKFDPLDYDEVIAHHPLGEHALSQSTVSARAAPLSFQEVQSRVQHNHLAICTAEGAAPRAAYVDAELRVVGVDLDEALKPTFKVLYELPRPIHSSAATSIQREYPSATFVGDGSALVVSDGCGTLYALRISRTGPADLLGAYELPSDKGAPTPFHVHCAAARPSGLALVLSFKHPTEDTGAPNTSRPPTASFDVWGVQISLDPTPTPEIRPLDVLWHRRGEDVPVYTTYDATHDAFILAGSAPFRPTDSPPAPTYTPTQDELAPIPRAGENLDADGDTAMTGPPKPPPYSWTQTSDSLTLAIPLPSSTPTSHIKVSFAPQTLSVLVSPHPSSSSPSEGALYAAAPLWDAIHPASSLWTFDRAAAHAYGLLTLHLDKSHAGTRWPHVFAPAFSAAHADEPVPETLDPSELHAIRDALEKWTADGAGEAAQGVPSLATGERDDDVDLAVGRAACLTWVPLGGSTETAAPAWDGAPVQILSLPLPGSTTDGGASLVLKHGLDGVLFALSTDGAWAHAATYSALAFVLASKRDTRYVHHVGARAVLAFESGARDLGGNVYIYRGAGARENWAKQAVLKIGGGAAGSLVGVGAVQVRGRTAILCLCEGELTVLRGAL